MKLYSKVLLLAFILLSVASCMEDKPLEDEKLGPPVEFLSMQQAFVDATAGVTPLNMKVGEYANFRSEARLYTGDFIQQGSDSSQVIDLGPSNDEIIIDGNAYPIQKSSTVIRNFLPIQNDGDPLIEDPAFPAKQWNCQFVKAPYYLWLESCELPPEQNLWIFQPIQVPTEPIFFSLAKYTGKQKLPKKMIDEGRCYGLPNCEMEVTYLEYDLVFHKSDGTRERRHYLTGFSKQLPYLASNVQTCFSTLYTHEGKKHPADICRVLIDFSPGQ